MFRHKDIVIDKLEELLIDYFVCDLIVTESISDGLDIVVTVITRDKERNIWELKIPLHARMRIHVRHFKDEIIIRERHFYGRVIEIKKEKYKGQHAQFLGQYVLVFHIKHGIYDLAFHNHYHIHKDISVAEILLMICDRHKILLTGNLIFLMDKVPKMLVQYGETDLHFFERILQYYGYYFVCKEDEDIVFVFDSHLGYEELSPGVEIYHMSRRENQEMGTVSYVNVSHKLQPRRYVSKDFDRKLPLRLEGLHVDLDPERYGSQTIYPNYANSEIESIKHAKHMAKQHVTLTLEGLSYCFDFRVGKKIIIRHIDDDLPKVITSVTHVFTTNSEIGFNNFKGYTYYNTFHLMHAEHDFVSDKVLEKPLITGIQTAVVAALTDINEIEVTKLGEVMVRFNWADVDHCRSCWIPVAQSMAGRCFGSFVIPRVGDEVLVYFINGDPDRPVVYGSLHTLFTPSFAIEPEDKFKTVLMRSHTFYDDDFFSCNEISFKDIKDDQKLYIKAQKKLEVHIGSEKDLALENNYITYILGHGRKEQYINDGDNLLDMRNGMLIERVRGDYETHVLRGDKGGSYLIRIEEGDLVIDVRGAGIQKYDALLDIKIVGDCRIKADGMMDISSRGLMNLHSDEEILMTAPKITSIADGVISQKSGGDISSEAVGRVGILSGAETAIKSGDMIRMEAVTDIAMEAAGDITAKSIGMISMDSDMITLRAISECNTEAGMRVGIESGLDVGINSGLNLSMKSGLSTNIESGVDISLESGLSLGMNAGLDIHMAGGLSASMEGGLSAAIRGGLSAGLTAGLSAHIEGGLSSEIVAGLSCNMSSGLVCGIDAGLELEAVAGCISTFFLGIIASISTDIEVFVKRPRLF